MKLIRVYPPSAEQWRWMLIIAAVYLVARILGMVGAVLYVMWRA